MKARSYSIDVFMQGVARILGGFFSFIAVFLLTYLFSESEIGEYNLILSTVNIIASLSTLWLSQSVLRYYDENKDLGAVILLLGASTIAGICAYLIFNVFADQTHSIWPYAYIVLMVFYNVFDAVFRRARRLKDYVMLELLLAIGRVFPMLFLAKLTHDYNMIFASQCIVVAFFLVYLLIKEHEAFKTTNYSVSKRMFRQYMKFGLPLMGLAISNWFLTTSDRYIIKFYDSNKEVGIYSTNYNLANSIYMMFSLIVVNAYHPIIMKEWNKDKKETLHLVSHALDLYIMLMVPVTFYGCLKSNILLGLFKGNLYASQYWIFNWTALGIFFYGISLLFHKFYELTQRTNVILLLNIIAALSNIIMNFTMIPFWGYGIAAFTTFLSYIIYILIVRLLTFRKFKVHINTKILTISISSAAFFGFFDHFLIKDNNIITFFIEGIVYVIYTAFVYQTFGILKLKKIRNIFH